MRKLIWFAGGLFCDISCDRSVRLEHTTSTTCMCTVTAQHDVIVVGACICNVNLSLSRNGMHTIRNRVDGEYD